MTRKQMYRRRRITLVVFIAIIALLISGICRLVHSDEAPKYKQYYITEGDTLWTICREEYGDKVDVRKYIYDIEKYNDISADIYAGQVIYIPEGELK